MHDVFRAGFLKLAAPRWARELSALSETSKKKLEPVLVANSKRIDDSAQKCLDELHRTTPNGATVHTRRNIEARLDQRHRLPEDRKGPMIRDAKKFLKESAFIDGFMKTAGGPGSGVSGYNTRQIHLPQSKHVSVGTRKALINNADYETHEISMDDIEAVCQKKYVPKKVARMVRDFDKVKDKPIDVLQVHDGKYHVVDGHHRYLAHLVEGSKHLTARVFKRRANA